MSAIQKAILKVCDIEGQAKEESRQDFLKRCLKAINKLDDKDYDKLDKDTLAWFNSAADVADSNKKKDKGEPLPDFPDMKKDEDEDKPRRRRGAEDDEDSKADKGSKEDKPAAPKVGDQVVLVTKRGKEQKGKIVEMDKDVIVLAQGTEEVEFDMDRVGSIEHDPAFSKGASKDDTPATPAGPAKGDKVKLKTKRGREVTGKIVSITDEEVVLETDDGEEDFTMARVEGIEVLNGSNKSKADDKADKGKGKDDEEEKRPRAGTRANGGVSIGQRIKELIVEDLKASKEDIGKQLTKEKLEYRPNTLDLAYAENHKLIDLLKAAKLLK